MDDYPSVQLILLVDDLQLWEGRLKQLDFSKYNYVDIMLAAPEKDFLARIGGLLYNSRVFLHANTPGVTVEQLLNQFVRKNCQFYVVISDCENAYIEDWPELIYKWVIDNKRPLNFVYQHSKTFENFCAYTRLHMFVGGFGSQPFYDKMYIFASNEDCFPSMVQFEDFVNGQTTDCGNHRDIR